MDRVVQRFDSLAAADDAEDAYYARLSPQERLDILLELLVWTHEVDGASSHSGRRTFATNLANQGTGIRVLMRLMGHRNISTTAVYIDANDDMLRRAVELA